MAKMEHKNPNDYFLKFVTWNIESGVIHGCF